MYCYGDYERELEEKTGHSIEDFMDDDYFISRGLCDEDDCEDDCEGE